MNYIHKLNRFIYNLAVDFRYGAFLGGVKKTKYLHKGANDTANSDYKVLPHLFSSIVEPHDVLVDVGCGKGRVLNWWLSNYREHKIYGIELDPEIAEQTRKRLKRYPKVEIICGDVCEKLPEDADIFYLFNPFDGRVMAAFRAALIGLAIRGGRPLKVLYYNPIHADVFLENPRFTVTPVTLPPQFHKALLFTVSGKD